MKEIRDFEKRLWDLMASATEERDLSRIQQLNPIAQDLERVKKDAQKIQEAIDRLEDKLEGLGSSGGDNSAGKSRTAPASKKSQPKSPSDEPELVLVPEEEVTASTSGGSVSWKVTDDDLGQNTLSTTHAKKAGLIPKNGDSFVIETSLGQVFKTNEVSNQNRLREKKKIREFYEGAGIKSGDKVVWTQIRPNTYRLQKT